MSRLSSLTRRALGVTVLAAATALPASTASAASSFQFDQFKVVDGTRYVLTVSKQRQLPGVDPAIWPKGYRQVCSITGPNIRFRVNWITAGDVADWNANVYFAPKGTTNYALWGGRPTSGAYISVAPPTPQVIKRPLILESVLWDRKPANLPLSPKLGGYDLQIVPTTYLGVLGYGIPVPAAPLSATLSVVQGTDAQCPASGNADYFRASI